MDLLAKGPEAIEYKGLPTYKRMMMVKNYLQFVPAEYHDDVVYQDPSEEEKKKEMLDQKARREAKKKRKIKNKATIKSERTSDPAAAASNDTSSDPTGLGQDL